MLRVTGYRNTWLDGYIVELLETQIYDLGFRIYDLGIKNRVILTRPGREESGQ